MVPDNSGIRFRHRRVKPPAVAGLFYPGEPEALRRAVRGLLAATAASGPPPKALIAPHAGLPYSGPVAASAYVHLRGAASRVERVVLIGPAHRMPIRGLAVSSAEAFSTPLGEVLVDREAVSTLLPLPGVSTRDDAFVEEHGLEVHLPFLIEVLGRFRIVPILTGEADEASVTRALEALWGGPETLVVVSSDLSHHLDYEAARARDAATCRAIEALDGSAIGNHDACGRVPVRGLLRIARARGLPAETVDLRSSGDTAGPRDRVVGYGAWLFRELAPRPLDTEDRARLLEVARESMGAGITGADPDPWEHSAALRHPRASFVTLRQHGALRGCMGTLEARRPLVVDVAVNARNAAFRDPRFEPLATPQIEGLEVGISVLAPPEPLPRASRAELLRALRPGVDGLILEDGHRRATFLPAVWQTLPDPQGFLEHLLRKAGLSPEAWPADLRLQRYTAESF